MATAITQRSFGGPEVLEVVDVERPDPAALAGGEVLVRVAAAGVNPVDTQTRRGEAVAGLMGGFPFTVGWDLAGTVEALGPDVPSGQQDAGAGLTVGDRVFGMARFPQQAAAYAQYAVVPADDLVRTPDSVADEQAAALPLAALTAWQDLVDVAGLRAGQRVFIQGGGGGVGHLAVQLAHHLGAHVITTASAGKHDWLTSLGADQVIDYTREDFTEVLRSAPVDIVLDTVSGPLGPPSVAVLKPGGLLIELPGVSEETQAAADAAGIRAAYHAVHTDRAQLTQIAALAGAGTLAVTVSHVYPLADAGDAHRALEGGHITGKLVLRP